MGGAFTENDITQIIMPGDVVLELVNNMDLMGDGTKFKDYYEEQDKQAGTYILEDDEWELQ